MSDATTLSSFVASIHNTVRVVFVIHPAILGYGVHCIQGRVFISEIRGSICVSAVVERTAVEHAEQKLLGSDLPPKDFVSGNPAIISRAL
jgi:hypothetical protein